MRRVKQSDQWRTAAYTRRLDQLSGEARHLLERLKALCEADLERRPKYPKGQSLSSDEIAAAHRWYQNHAAFHGEDGEPLEEVVEIGERLWQLGRKKLITLVIEALPEARDCRSYWRDELNCAFTGCGHWEPLKKWKR